MNKNDSTAAKHPSSLPTKLLGVYPQRQEGLYLQRIPVFAGHITPSQLQQLAEIAIELTHAEPLHLTTRQDIELHEIQPSDLNTIQSKLHQIGLATFGAGGDSVRNITVCPCCRFDAEAFDIQPLADFVKEILSESPLLETMPRKFKLSFAGCGRPHSKPYVNDLAFIATSATTVRVIGAGSLGARPETGIVLYNSLPVEDVIPLALASLNFFVDQGDRENRRKARFRHIRQRLGDAVFRETLEDYFRIRKESRSWPNIKLTKGWMGWNHRRTLQTVNGNLNPQHALLLAQAVKEQDAQIRINLHHGIEIFSKESFTMPQPLEKLTELPCIVSCPGSTTCKNGLTNCPQVAEQLSERLKGDSRLVGKIIALSGCPNNCAQSSIADIGLSGQLKTIDGKRQEVYKVTLNGGNGSTDKLGEIIETVSAENLPERIADYISKLEQ